MVRPSLAPWQVWWTDFNPQVGREQAGRRPAIIVGSKLACGLPNGLVVVVPMTTRNRNLPFHPPVDLEGVRSYAMTDQIKSISIERLHKLHSRGLSATEIESIQFALRRMLDV